MSILINHEITYDTDMKRHLRPPCTPFERAEGAVLPSCLHSPACLCILFYTHSLCSLLATMCHCNESKLYQRSPEAERFITAKISANALKQGSRTH